MIWVWYRQTGGITGFPEEDFDWWWKRVPDGIFFYATLSEADV